MSNDRHELPNPYLDWLDLDVDHPDAYELLGVSHSETDSRLINAAYYRAVARVSKYQLGSHRTLCLQMLAELNDARNTINRTIRSHREDGAEVRLKSRHLDRKTATVESAVKSTRSDSDSAPLSAFFGVNDHAAASGGIELPTPSFVTKKPGVFSIMTTPEEVIAATISRRGLTPEQEKLYFETPPDQLVIGPYLLEYPLAEGFWGPTFLASRLMTGRMVAFRKISSPIAEQFRVMRGLKRRAAALQSDAFQRVVDSGTGKQAFICSEFLPGESLDSLVRRVGALAPQKAVYCLGKIVEAMGEAHNAGMVHHELRPSKILVNQQGQLFIRDLLLANVVQRRKQANSNSQKLTQTLPISHLQYMAPEVLLGEADDGVGGDVYSLGCLLFFLLTGKPPFDVNDRMRLCVAHQESPAPAISSQSPDLAYADPVIRKMLAKSPNERYQSYAELHKDLLTVYKRFKQRDNIKLAWQEVLEQEAPNPVQPVASGRLHLGRIVRNFILTAVVGIGLGAAIIYVPPLLKPDAEQPQPIAPKPTQEKPREPGVLHEPNTEEIPVVDSEVLLTLP